MEYSCWSDLFWEKSNKILNKFLILLFHVFQWSSEKYSSAGSLICFPMLFPL